MNRLITILLMAVPLLFAACSDDDDHYTGRPGQGNQGGNNSGINAGPLNQYEQALVGSYVSDDIPERPIYIVLNSDRSGSLKQVGETQTTYDEFRWCAGNKVLTLQYTSDDSYEDLEYYYANEHLYIKTANGDVPFINAGEPEQPQNPIVGQWQGTINGYYSAVWELDDTKCVTILEFMADGGGCQLDYMPESPKTDYAYTPFAWTQVGDIITITYAPDSRLSAARISNYALTSAKFTGQIAYGLYTFTFGFDSVTGFNWGPYQTYTVSQAKCQTRLIRQAGTGTVRHGVFAERTPRIP